MGFLSCPCISRSSLEDRRVNDEGHPGWRDRQTGAVRHERIVQQGAAFTYMGPVYRGSRKARALWRCRNAVVRSEVGDRDGWRFAVGLGPLNLNAAQLNPSCDV